MREEPAPVVLRFDSLPSTNTEAARQAAAGAREWLCVVASEQTAGRGRQGRAWESPPGAGLYFSVVLRPRLDASLWPLLTLTAAVAVSDALRETCALDVDIKWPNDLLAGGRKVCGILAEAVEGAPSYKSGGRACVVGVGVNLRADSLPPELRERAASVEELTGTTPDYERLLESLVRALAERYASLHAEGGARELLREWAARSSYAEGRRVRVSLGEECFEGTTRGLESDGALRVETDEGDLRVVRAGDVTALR
ncbi:MAG TPA: biotin--[acetyl-CoA-carboxylase] ligase [Pyrinomonadaceae bacterium]|nr:biotin--[acetyl-CoA-carboxylase] ligase [Pyrinomonadaceae bacterium]